MTQEVLDRPNTTAQPNSWPGETEMALEQLAQPPEMLLGGIHRDAVVNLGETILTSLGETSLLDRRPWLGAALRLSTQGDVLTFLDKISTGEQVSGAEMTEKLSDVHPGVAFINGLKPDGVLRRAGEHIIQRQIDRRQATAAKRAREVIENLGLEGKIERDARLLADTPNPRKQVMQELGMFATDARQSIETAHQTRIALEESGRRAPLPPPPPGFKGAVVKAYRAVKRFFGFFRGKAAINREVTAADAAFGLHDAANRWIEHSVATEKRAPIVSAMLDYIPMNKLKVPSLAQLSFAPEVLLMAIFSVTEDADPNDESLIDSIKRNPSDLRVLATRFSKTKTHALVSRLQTAAQNILPAALAVIPAEGKHVQAVYDRVKRLVYPSETAPQQPATLYQQAKAAAKDVWQQRSESRRRRRAAKQLSRHYAKNS